MSSPAVSVVMSVYKDRGTLKDTVASVLGQSFTDLELIVIDDASPDDALSLLRELARSDPRMSVIANERNLGLTRSLNRGLEVARGAYIARIDEGDLWVRDKIARQVDFLERHPDHVLVGTQYVNYPARSDGKGRARRMPTADADLRKWLFCGLNPLNHPSLVFRNGLAKYNPRATTSQDFDLSLRLALLGKIANLPDELVKTARPPDAISATRQDAQFFNHLCIHEQFLDVLKGKACRERFIEEGTSFERPPALLEMRRRYMAQWLTRLNRIRNERWRKILRNALIPDMLCYFLCRKSAPYRMRRLYDAWTRRG